MFLCLFMRITNHCLVPLYFALWTYDFRTSRVNAEEGPKWWQSWCSANMAGSRHRKPQVVDCSTDWRHVLPICTRACWWILYNAGMHQRRRTWIWGTYSRTAAPTTSYNQQILKWVKNLEIPPVGQFSAMCICKHKYGKGSKSQWIPDLRHILIVLPFLLLGKKVTVWPPNPQKRVKLWELPCRHIGPQINSYGMLWRHLRLWRHRRRQAQRSKDQLPSPKPHLFCSLTKATAPKRQKKTQSLCKHIKNIAVLLNQMSSCSIQPWRIKTSMDLNDIPWPATLGFKGIWSIASLQPIQKKCLPNIFKWHLGGFKIRQKREREREGKKMFKEKKWTSRAGHCMWCSRHCVFAFCAWAPNGSKWCNMWYLTKSSTRETFTLRVGRGWSVPDTVWYRAYDSQFHQMPNG